MIRSLYIAATGMITQRSKMDVITNNVANADTTGYKSDRMISRSFEDMLLERIGDPSVVSLRPEVGPLNTGTHIDEIMTDFSGGSLEETGETTDLAIQGDGFFCIQTPQGVAYTRSGNFYVNAEGDVVTQEGYYVLGKNGGRIHTGTASFTVSEDGTFWVDGNMAGSLRIVQFNDTAALRKTGDNLYVSYNNEQPTQVEAPVVRQGFLESSNVDIATEMVDMLTVSRAYESNQRVIKMVDGTLDKAVNELARF
jgi:flagellar basal-body rod protein FlgG